MFDLCEAGKGAPRMREGETGKKQDRREAEREREREKERGERYSKINCTSTKETIPSEQTNANRNAYALH